MEGRKSEILPGSIRTQARATNRTHVLYPEGLYNIFFLRTANATVDRNFELKNLIPLTRDWTTRDLCKGRIEGKEIINYTKKNDFR